MSDCNYVRSNAPKRYLRHAIETGDTSRLTTEPADFPGTIESYDEACESAYCNCDRCEGLR